MAEPGDHDVTQLITAWRAGDEGARDVMMSIVYGNVRAIAGQSLRKMPGATLSATELAHEALLRMLGTDAPWESRRHFYHVVAQATRQVLVDAARRRVSAKRGSGAEHVDIDAALEVGSTQSDSTLMRLDSALDELAEAHERRARMIELVYFGGLSRNEVAAVLEVSDGTVDRDLRLARAWLRSVLEA